MLTDVYIASVETALDIVSCHMGRAGDAEYLKQGSDAVKLIRDCIVQIKNTEFNTRCLGCDMDPVCNRNRPACYQVTT